MTSFWSGWVIFMTLTCLLLVTWLLFANSKSEKPKGQQTTGHIYDGIEELENPLPRWWFLLFVATLLFAVGYFVAYPALGNFAGVLGWSSKTQWEKEMQQAEAKYGPIFAEYRDKPLEELIQDRRAIAMGQRIFGNNCSVCHGSDARGNLGYPNLTDNDWLYGGTPEAITNSIRQGRQGNMPAWGKILTAEDLEAVANYVEQLAGKPANQEKVKQGAVVYQSNCGFCHGAEGKGMAALGAPNLTDEVWLYGGAAEQIRESISGGRAGNMPAQKELLSSDKIHLVAGYVYSLSHE